MSKKRDVTKWARYCDNLKQLVINQKSKVLEQCVDHPPHNSHYKNCYEAVDLFKNLKSELEFNCNGTNDIGSIFDL